MNIDIRNIGEVNININQNNSENKCSLKHTSPSRPVQSMSVQSRQSCEHPFRPVRPVRPVRSVRSVRSVRPVRPVPSRPSRPAPSVPSVPFRLVQHKLVWPHAMLLETFNFICQGFARKSCTPVGRNISTLHCHVDDFEGTDKWMAKVSEMIKISLTVDFKQYCKN